ncbi:MAG: hypothetical protein QOJ36_1353, partial [Verrucomicrobiota bacterium]
QKIISSGSANPRPLLGVLCRSSVTHPHHAPNSKEFIARTPPCPTQTPPGYGLRLIRYSLVPWSQRVPNTKCFGRALSAMPKSVAAKFRKIAAESLHIKKAADLNCAHPFGRFLLVIWIVLEGFGQEFQQLTRSSYQAGTSN